MDFNPLFVKTQNHDTNLSQNACFDQYCSPSLTISTQMSDTSVSSSPYLGDLQVSSPELRSQSPIKSTSPYFRKNQFRIEGHRGFGRYEPENTYQAFTRAIDANLDGIELDVWLTSDKVPVIIHTAEGVISYDDGTKSIVYETSFEELRSKKILNNNLIPTLEEVLRLTRKKICVNIEFKGFDLDAAELSLRAVQEEDMCEQVQFSSFNWKFYDALKTAAKKLGILDRIPFGFLVEDPELLDERLFGGEAGDGITFDWRLLNTDRQKILNIFQQAKQKGYNVKVYFSFKITEVHEIYQELESLGIETVITNEPALLKKYFEGKNTRSSNKHASGSQLESIGQITLISAS